MADNQEQKINERLKLVRKTFKKNQKEFAERLGYKQSFISELENGVKNISKAIIFTLHKELGVNPEWFETGIGEMFLSDPRRDPIIITLDKDADVGEFLKGMGYKRDPRESVIHEPYDTTDIKDKLIKCYEKNLRSQDKNIQLLEEVSRLKDQIIEAEREIRALMSEEKNRKPAGTRVL